MKDKIERIIEEFIEALPANVRMYSDLYAARLAQEIVDSIGDTAADFHVRSDAPETSKSVVDKIRSGSLQSTLLSQFVIAGILGKGGFTDDEMEERTGRTHQSVSATRNTLMRKGYLADSGVRRPTRSGNPAIVYVYTGKDIQILNREAS